MNALRLMRSWRDQLLFVLACGGFVATLDAQGAAAIPVRVLRVIAQSDSGAVASVASVRALAGGSVVVNDVGARRLLRLDAALRNAAGVADTTARLPYTYGLSAKAAGLVPWTADSTLFIDSDSKAILVINPAGSVVKIIGAVKAADLGPIASATYGYAGNDSRGHLLYESVVQFDPFARIRIGSPRMTISYPDSNPILRADFQQRTIDTIATVTAPVQKIVWIPELGGGGTMNAAVNPLPGSDDWTILRDGTIAIVRTKDYHIDWVAPDGTRTSSPSMPFDWRSITPGEKQQMVDSVKRGMDEARAKQFAAGGTSNTSEKLNITVDARDIPDFYPPIRVNQTRADSDGRVWILPSTSSGARGGLLYDVADRQGKLVERVQLPPGRALVGFGRGGVVYLANAVGVNRSILERAEIVR